MQADNVIEVHDITKSFKVYYDKGRTLKERLVTPERNKTETRWVLKGISFDVKKGEAIGLIGKNGCGKSTTLKLLTRIIYPDSGCIELKGRVSSLLELGAGFHPDMSGRENIYLNAAIFGLTKKEIDKKIDEIIKFSELEDFIENPVRTYSSGMYMRLAFAVAINVEADILLIDEILAVGDISFQKKCFEKLKEIKRAGTSIVIVSHSLDQIEKICDRCIWIENGIIKEAGHSKKISEDYLIDMESKRLERFQEEYYSEIETIDKNEEKESVVQVENTKLENIGLNEEIKQLSKNLLKIKRKEILDRKVYFSEMYITDIEGKEKLSFETGDDIIVYIKYIVDCEHAEGSICFLVYRDDGVYCFGTNTYFENKQILNLKEYSILKITLKHIELLSGKYFFCIGLNNEEAVTYDYLENAACIHIFSNKGDLGVARITSEWDLQ
ncbi:ATP-binding cassette domain-containing protein [Roseburia faecis]|jgi:ABC-2 type transport system ATP-binding protein|uniref:ATP-binding cassette domain-containing protein n=1 Tax=Roseburia faecis TaxID=301302 RepID=A0A844KQZ2_9FIRM|nr:ABC transporter ATP-binding protein [Roseburia faecis]MTR82611.1 ATP-binding cassette domain-containing protein [Roseburia faecis]MTR92021.1 ATP-binding cassette domain-containing protein [Roseburia faecis]